jgi:ornithine cyclodeaminase
VREPIWISEGEASRLLDLPVAIDAVREGFRREAEGAAFNMAKTHLAWGGGQLHAIGAALPGEGLVGTKTWAHTPDGATPLLVVWDTNGGALLAIIEAFRLGQLRTAAVSGVATDLLAVAGADTLAICGTGRQAFPQVAAIAAVRRLRRVFVYGRNPGRRATLASDIEGRLGIPAVACELVEAAVSAASIVTLVTRATLPFLSRDVVRQGAHVNAVGSITLERSEFDSALLERCTVIAADSPRQARELSSELRGYLGDDDAAWECVRPLAELVALGMGRPKDADVTLFKALGVGIADLSLARVVLERAREQGLGRPIPSPRREEVVAT